MSLRLKVRGDELFLESSGMEVARLDAMKALELIGALQSGLVKLLERAEQDRLELEAKLMKARASAAKGEWEW